MQVFNSSLKYVIGGTVKYERIFTADPCVWLKFIGAESRPTYLHHRVYRGLSFRCTKTTAVPFREVDFLDF
jgi:hypothetical protein